MGKRKSRRPKAPPKKQNKLETAFACPFCGHQKSVDCELEKKEKEYMFGTAACWVCNASYSAYINDTMNGLTSVNGSKMSNMMDDPVNDCERITSVEDVAA
ncbi:Transcription elongation factor [Trema orientale]|uniref:Transcription elongation factor 1 homolog n=1 Tax=Trema orientale TaxID=63057 RepID=A0A2P5EP20_TREOI|nr:Transcription elongation factor [Trema orientale]